jgi:hypothetical protein
VLTLTISRTRKVFRFLDPAQHPGPECLRVVEGSSGMKVMNEKTTLAVRLLAPEFGDEELS